ncbi:Ldh family oxidoreductase [Bacilliculturomica massiliensis]|uniref:Ldh family oxidoreductase n=1 Tax=Bacilliculturomica massiliensis TaxID=1917867 RepID=UPI0010304E01|nr:Ldh family oxidoreductase [Bacilliculturomica massiliensis]
MDNIKIVQAETIKSFVSELFEKVGMSGEDAAWFAETITTANLRGLDSHGILRVPNYVERVKCGAINPCPDMKIVQLSPAVALIDADDAAGCVAGKKAMECAIETAKKFGVGIAAVKNSNHFGAGAAYAQLAVDRDMIGIVLTDVPTLITAPGAKAKLVGNNPIGIGIPTYSNHPFMLDMSLSVVAEGKLRFAAEKGSKIPTTWAADMDGNPTDDPEAALKGFLLPIAGYKGLGLAYVVDILCGVLTSGIFADKIKSMYRNPTEPSQIGHMMLAIDLQAFLSKEEMKERMEYYHSYLESAPLVEGATPLCFPGEIEHNCCLRRVEAGIPVPITTLEKLNALQSEYGMISALE